MTRAALNRQINTLLVKIAEANGIDPAADISTMLTTGLLSVALDRLQPELIAAATAGAGVPAAAKIAETPVAA